MERNRTASLRGRMLVLEAARATMKAARAGIGMWRRSCSGVTREAGKKANDDENVKQR